MVASRVRGTASTVRRTAHRRPPACGRLGITRRMTRRRLNLRDRLRWAPLRHTTSRGAAWRSGDSTSASQPDPSQGAIPPPPNPGPPPRQPKLLDHLAEALRSRHDSRRTDQTYRPWVKRFLCHACARRRLRHPNYPGTLGPQGCHDDHDLRPRPEQGRSWRPQPRRSTLVRFIQTA